MSPDSLVSTLTRQRYEALTKLVDASRERARWLVVMHDNPDPDALASAAILARILRAAFHRRVTVGYGGMVGRAENQEMVRSLGLELSRVRHLNWRHYQHFALVDCQPRTGNHGLPDDIVPDVVIDHHPPRKATLQSRFYDIRPHYGATATVLAEYLLASGLPHSQKGATSIVYAIRTETQDFGRESAGPDRALYDHFFPLANKRLLGRIQYPKLPLSYFVTLHRALDNVQATDTLVVCHLGVISQPDIVAEMADFFLRMEGKTWSLCTGLLKDRIYVSIRTTNPRADAARVVRRLLGRRGKGGGHGMIAGGWYDLGSTKAEEALKLERDLARKLARLLRKNPDRLTRLELDEKRSPEPPMT